MNIINNKQKALKELKRISQRTSSDDNKNINSIVEEILLNSWIAFCLLFIIFIFLNIFKIQLIELYLTDLN